MEVAHRPLLWGCFIIANVLIILPSMYTSLARHSPSVVHQTPEPPLHNNVMSDDANSDSSKEGGIRIPIENGLSGLH